MYKSGTALENPGLHLVAYYCSAEHLILKVAVFLQQGLEVGEKCYYYLKPREHELLDCVLQHLGVDVFAAKQTKQLVLLPFDEIYQRYKSEGLDSLRNIVEEMAHSSIEEGFNGVRWVGDSQYGIMNLDVDHFQNWENELEHVIRGVPMISLCFYDVEDLLLDKGNATNIIQKTMNSHQYIYNENKIIRTDLLQTVKNRLGA